LLTYLWFKILFFACKVIVYAETEVFMNEMGLGKSLYLSMMYPILLQWRYMFCVDVVNVVTLNKGVLH